MWHKNYCETEGTKQGERKIGMWKATISPEKRKKIRRSVSFFLSLLLILEMVSGTGMFAEGNRVKAKEETPYAVYLDLSGSSTAEALAVCITMLHDAAIGTPVFLTKNGRGRYAILDMQDFEKTQATIRLMNELAKGRSENLSLTGLAQSYSLTNNS